MSAVRYVNFARFNELHGDDIQAVFARVLASGVYIGGTEVEEFEREFAAYCGTAFAVGVANGLEALELTLRAWGIGAGDDVVAPANTAVPTALAVSHTGARVVFADVAADTGLMTAATFAAVITPATRAVIPVHLYGHPVDMEPLRAQAARRGIRVLEDAAHAHGARLHGRRCGSLADAAAFSFYPTKNLGAIGDAGCVTTDDATLASEVRLLRNIGLTTQYRHVRRGFTSRLDPLQAALLRWKLERLDGWNDRRRAIAQRYCAELADVEGLTLPTVSDRAEPVWHAFPVLVADGQRDALVTLLHDRGIETNVHYRVPVHLQPSYEDHGGRAGDFPVSESRAAAQCSLPLDPLHTDDEIRRVIETLRSVSAR